MHSVDGLSPLRVLSYCEKWQPGGIQVTQMRLMWQLLPHGIAFDVLVSVRETDLYDEELARCGATLRTTLTGRYASPAKRTLHNFWALYRLLRRTESVIFHCNVCHGVELAYLFIAWLARIPVRIAHCRNNGIGAGGGTRGVKMLMHHICKRAFGWCATIRLANSELSAQWLFSKRQNRRRQVEILPNGIDAPHFAFSAEKRDKVRRELGLEGALVVGHIGHFSYQKNHSFLLRVFQEVRQRRADAVLVLVGGGSLEQDIRAEVKALGLEDAVRFLGTMADTAPVLSAMDVFVLPSRFEGFGNVLLEAQASGLPCFASAGTVPEAVRVSETLRFLPLENPKAWADEICACALDGPRAGRDGDVTRAGYAIQSMADRLLRIYRQSMGDET